MPPLVTGAAGFAGSHLLDHLLDHAPHVLAWGSPRGIPDADRGGRVGWTAVDVTDGAAVQRAVDAARPSAIYHLAGMADVHGAWADSARPLRVNALGTHHLVTALARSGLDVPLLVTGSALVYEGSTAALTEESRVGPSSPYGVSKLAQEMLAARAPGRVLLTRSFNHAGPRQSPAYVTSSFARQIAEIEAGRRPPVLSVGNLDARRDVTDVRDTVRAYRLLLERGRSHRPYNVCRGEAFRIGDLLQQLVAAAAVPIEIQVDPARLRPADNPVVLGSPARLTADTGWRPAITIDRTLQDLLDYWRQQVAASAAG